MYSSTAVKGRLHIMQIVCISLIFVHLRSSFFGGNRRFSLGPRADKMIFLGDPEGGKIYDLVAKQLNNKSLAVKKKQIFVTA